MNIEGSYTVQVLGAQEVVATVDGFANLQAYIDNAELPNGAIVYVEVYANVITGKPLRRMFSGTMTNASDVAVPPPVRVNSDQQFELRVTQTAGSTLVTFDYRITDLLSRA